MKRTAALLALVIGLAGCAFATKHPAATAGIVGSTIGFSFCYMAVEKLETCGKVGGAAGVGLGGVTWLATTFLASNEDELPQEAGMERVPGSGPPPGPYLPPEPNPLPVTALPDAGVPGLPMAADAGVAPADASSAD